MWRLVSVLLLLSLQASCVQDDEKGAGPSPQGQQIGPAGGTLTFSNGVRLVFAPGAVAAPTEIVLEELSTAQIDTILANPIIGQTRKKRFLGGFSTKPDGLTFAAPVQMVLPIGVLEPSEIPVPLTLNLADGSYQYSSTGLDYDGTEQRVTLELHHFSAAGVLAVGPQLSAPCTSCGTFGGSECEALDLLQTSCCLLSRANRTSCTAAAGCDCCREKRIRVKAAATDVGTRECQLLNDEVQITFLDCPGTPTETSSLSETTCKDLALTMRILEPKPQLSIGEEEQLQALVTGIRNGVPIFQDTEVLASWTSDAPEVADFVDPPGTLQAHKPSVVPLRVHAKWGDTGAQAEALVNVSCTDCKLTIDHTETRVLLDRTLYLTVRLRDSKGNEVSVDPGLIRWRSGVEGVVALDPDMGPMVAVRGARAGRTVVTASYADINGPLTDTVELVVAEGNSADASAQAPPAGL